MSNFDLLYSQHDINNNPFSSPKTTNYFENEIKQGLNFFQQNKLQSTLRNNFFSNTDSNMKMTTSEKMDKINIEAKKIIEREMDPYLSLIKKELNLILEKYNNEFQSKNEKINELLNMKSEIDEIKKSNEDIKTNLEQKIIKNNDSINNIELKINNMNSDINKFNQFFTIQLDNSSIIQNLSNDIDKLKQNLNLQEKNFQNLLSEQKTNTEQLISQKFNECIYKINNLKEQNETLQNKLDELNNSIRLMKANELEKNEEQINQLNSNKEIKNIIKQIKLDLENKENKIKNLEDSNENNKIKLDQINQNIEKAFKNISTEHISIIKIAKEYKDIISKIQKLEDLMDNSVYKKEFIDIKLNTIHEEIDSQNDKIKEAKIKLNENISEKNNKLNLDLTKKLEEYKNYFQNHYDELDGKISSINNQISEINTSLQTHPVLNMNNNEIITLKFKENQIKYNEIFKKAIEEMKLEIEKIYTNIKGEDNNKKNLVLFKDNFDKINEEINNIKAYPDIMNKIKEELDKKIIEEFEKSKKAQTTPNCREKCSGCGAACFGTGVCYE